MKYLLGFLLALLVCLIFQADVEAACGGRFGGGRQARVERRQERRANRSFHPFQRLQERRQGGQY